MHRPPRPVPITGNSIWYATSCTDNIKSINRTTSQQVAENWQQTIHFWLSEWRREREHTECKALGTKTNHIFLNITLHHQFAIISFLRPQPSTKYQARFFILTGPAIWMPSSLLILLHLPESVSDSWLSLNTSALIFFFNVGWVHPVAWW
jgi:hypothetical protein